VTAVSGVGAWSGLSLSYTGQVMVASQAVTVLVPQLTGLAASTWTVNGVSWTASTIASPTYVAYGAFNNTNASGAGQSWAGTASYVTTGTGLYNSTTNYTVVQGVGVKYGDWLQIQSSIPLVMYSYTFGIATPNISPYSYSIVGSNDGITWYPLQQAIFATTPYTTPTTNIHQAWSTPCLINLSGTQTITCQQSGTCTTTSFPTSANAYTYFRLSVQGLWPVNGNGAICEVEEWYINFISGGTSYSTNAGQTWTNTYNVPIANAITVSGNGQYVLGASGAVTTNNMPQLTGIGSSGTSNPTSPWTSNGVTWTGSASNVFGTNNSIYLAFNNIYSASWASGTQYSSAGVYGANVTTTILGGVGAIKGEWLQIQSSIPLVMNSYTFAAGGYQGLPAYYYIVGSTDNTNWYPLQYAVIGGGSSNPLSSNFTACSTYLLVNVSGNQTLTGSTTVSVATTSYPTSTTAYTYFRIICTQGFATSNTYFELGEWFINFTNPNSLQSAYVVPTASLTSSSYTTSTLSTVNANVVSTAASNTGQYMAMAAGAQTMFGEWIQLQLVTAVSVTSYVVAMRSTNPESYPAAWNMLGSTDGVNWTILDTRTGNSASYITCTLATTSAVYAYYRIVFTKINSSAAGFVDIGGFILYNNAGPIFAAPTTTSAIAPYTLSGTNNSVLSLNSIQVCTTTWSWTSTTSTYGITNNGNTTYFYPGIIAVANAYNNTANTGGAGRIFLGFNAATPNATTTEYNSNYLAIQGTFTNAIGPNLYYSTNYGSTFTGVTLGSTALVSCTMSFDGSYITAASATAVYTLNANGSGYSVAVGASAGANNQAQNAIAIGNGAGQVNQTANSIILNASGAVLNSFDQGFYVAPVQSIITTQATGVPYNLLSYGSYDNQVIYSGIQVQNSAQVVYGEWIQLQLATGVSITSYQLQPRVAAPLRYPLAFTLVGSTDGIIWTVVDSQSGQNSFSSYTLKAPSAIYTYFRIVFTSINSTGYVDIGGFILYNNGNTIFGPYANYSVVQSGNYNILQYNSITVCTVTWSWPNTNGTANTLGISGDGTGSLSTYQPGWLVTSNSNTKGDMLLGFQANSVGPGYEYSASTASPPYTATQGTATVVNTTALTTLGTITAASATISTDLVAQGIYLTPSAANAPLILAYIQKVVNTITPVAGVAPFWANGYTYGTVGSLIPAYAYQGGVLLPNGNVVLVPTNGATYVGIYNPYTNTYSTTGSATGYAGGVLLPNGNVLFVPSGATVLGMYNPTTNVFTTTVGTYTAGAYTTTISATGYTGGVLLPNGNVLLSPTTATSIGIYNPTTGILSTAGPTAGSYAFIGCVLLPNGNVILVPWNATYIGIYNSTTNVYSTSGTISSLGGSAAYLGGTLLPNGNVMLNPVSSGTIAIYNPTTNVFTTVATVSGQYQGSVLLPNGNVLLVPTTATSIGIYNPYTNTFSTTGSTPGSNAYLGGVLMLNGNVLLVTSNSGSIGIVSTGLTAPREMCLSPYFNKL